jgi:hypothetical protein
VLHPLALLRVHCKRASDRGRCHAAEHHDELAAAFQLIELHSVPPSTMAVAGYRIGVSQSGRVAVCEASMSAVEVKRAFIGLELGLGVPQSLLVAADEVIE